MRDPRFAEHLAVYVDVVRTGSFSAASRRRAVTPSAVVRQIDALEKDLGVPLLVRSTRALSLTDAGRHLFERAQRLLDDLADTHAEVAAFDGAVSGTLRIACFPTFGKRYVIPVLASLAQDYPSLHVELDLTERLADPVAERLDLVVRMGDLQDSSLIATKLAPHDRIVVASPAYLEHYGVPESAEALRQHRVLDKLHGNDLLGWSNILGAPTGEACERVVFRSDDFEAMNGAAIAGMGVAFLPSWVSGPSVQAGDLVRLPLSGEGWNERPSGIYLLRALQVPSAKIRAFTEALKNHIGAPPRWS
ncbi:LysR family transcriptional regulator [Agrobacterium radiobacter]|uniref:LysR family transcriptional regulator n=1 Tax=Agrobacterium radiobacter TaxID=362 RepID=UPI0003685C51|nr:MULTISPECIES: LysR family transcriptional regulator [Agrobacterium tumefaciens complex]EPR23299.1 LysR family transcriptional regulator [Agrobacterium radiobacter DSM 30147]KAB0459230.1 LysR family transcriptional regulator [Agrobacterium tumefaciens]KWT75432.1 LysR family transcriptional regulator [Agrobacterium radiobacter]NIB11645.1 LysR family transcriptional regulator [Agrobacterium radiobacter]OOO33153.1 LysR family transcriptional regulator [Agrobacterium radiobacter]